MDSDSRIRVIKRAQRERLEETAAGGAGAELTAPEKARGLAATVREWVSEFQQTRLARHQEIAQQHGWRRGGDDVPESTDVDRPQPSGGVIRLPGSG